MGTRGENKPQQNGQNGTMLPQPQPQYRVSKSVSSLPKRRARKCQSVQDLPSACEPLTASREASFCSQFNSLSINGTVPDSQEPQAILLTTPVTPTSSLSTYSRTSLLPPTVDVCNQMGGTRNQEPTPADHFHIGQVAPKTPSHTEMNIQLQKVHTSIRTILTPARGGFSSPTKPPFLSKYSNVTGFVATDIDERVGKLDNEFQKIKEMMDSTVMDKDKYIEELGIARKRGTCRNLSLPNDTT